MGKDASHKLSRWAIFVIAGFFLLVFFAGRRWEPGATLKADVVSYYSYLPATFIYGDISMEYAHHDTFFGPYVWGIETENGGFLQKYTMGLSVMYAPFFLAGHALAYVSGAPPDGYSWPYEFMLQLSAIFFVVLGFLQLRKLLFRYFDDLIVALTMLFLAFATNLCYYTIGHGPMPHAYLFFLLTTFGVQMVRFYENPSWKPMIWLALCAGLAVLIRPVHLLIFLLPILYGLIHQKGLKNLLSFFWRHKIKLLLIPIGIFLCWIPQIAYWKYMTGDWLFWSYNDEGFFWTQPEILKGLFGFRKGWLIYTPGMVLALAGFFLLGKYAKPWKWAIPVFWGISAYVIFSWWCWWYGGTFGQRPFIDFYGLLAIPVAAAFTWWMDRKKLHKKLRMGFLIVVIGLFSGLNLFQTLQYTRGVIHTDAMTFKAYKAGFGKLNVPEGFEEMLDFPDYDRALRARE